MSKLTPKSPFQPKSWWDLRTVLANIITKTVPQLPRGDIQDVLSEVMIDLLDKWVKYPSSISDDPKRNWNYAMKYAKWALPPVVIAHAQDRHYPITQDLDGLGTAIELSGWDDLSIEDSFVYHSDVTPEQAAATRKRLTNGAFHIAPVDTGRVCGECGGRVLKLQRKILYCHPNKRKGV